MELNGHILSKYEEKLLRRLVQGVISAHGLKSPGASYQAGESLAIEVAMDIGKKMDHPAEEQEAAEEPAETQSEFAFIRKAAKDEPHACFLVIGGKSFRVPDGSTFSFEIGGSESGNAGEAGKGAFLVHTIRGSASYSNMDGNKGGGADGCKR